MEKAARAVRRSGVKLFSIGGGHSDLNVLISQIKDIRSSAKVFLSAQTSASHDMQRWAANEQNRAVQDVSNKLTELNLLWTDVQKDFIGHIKQYGQMFDMVLEGEKSVAQGRTHLVACEQKEMKVRRDLKKAAKIASSDTIRILEARLSQAERAKNIAEIEVSHRIRENEAVKLIRIKEGLLRLSEAYIEMGNKCSVVFEAQRDISYQLPDVHGRALEDIKYNGSTATSYFVDMARERVKSYRRESHHLQSIPSVDDPPPPYTAVEESVDTSTESRSSSYSSPHNQPNLANDSGHSYSSPQLDHSSSTHSNTSNYVAQDNSRHDISIPSPHQTPARLAHSYSSPQIEPGMILSDLQSYHQTAPPADVHTQHDRSSHRRSYAYTPENHDFINEEMTHYHREPARRRYSENDTSRQTLDLAVQTTDTVCLNDFVEPREDYFEEPSGSDLHSRQDKDEGEELTGAMGGTQIW